MADAADATAAIDGGADIIDAKDPSRGPLGPVAPDALAAIVARVAGRRPVSAALDDTPGDLPRLAFAKLTRPRSVPGCAIVLAAFADRCWEHVIEVATRNRAHGVLLDTSDKNGLGLFGLVSEDALRRWVERAHEAGLTVALAGKLTVDDLSKAAALGADIAGVRGAACDGGRGGRVSAERVRALAGVAASAARQGTSPMPAFL
ncbi:MAG TPA: (5-formylfuran-3-yl)methyl phosphate synthase [Gemmatimonadaceae bacterium]|nr:(5-formylfuran-3-yl)methyl phosphate synthase [Gemmatimonadaceae bacterium]